MGPLTGLKVLDFSALLPGPWATQMLADMGADILRIESPSHPDMLRQLPAAFGRINRGKQALILDLNSAAAKCRILELLPSFDILLEQFRPGVMKRFGLDYPALKSQSPTLIYCSLTGYGQSGPYRDRAGHDINYQALAGIASYSGINRPTLSGIQIADLAGGSLQAIIAILAAVIERQQTGVGQQLDVSMSDGALSLNSLAAAATLQGEPAPEHQSEWLNGGIFYDYYRCADDLWLSVGGLEPKFIRHLCQALGKPAWESRFVDFRRATQDALKRDLQQLFATRQRQDWLNQLGGDTCVEPVLTLDQALSHPHFIAREMVETVDDKRQLSCPLKFPGSRLGR